MTKTINQLSDKLARENLSDAYRTLYEYVFSGSITCSMFMRLLRELNKRERQLRPDSELFAVYAKHLDRNVLLGYVPTQTKYEDVAAFFEERKGYGIDLEPVVITHVPRGFAEGKSKLAKRIEELKREIADLKAGKIEP